MKKRTSQTNIVIMRDKNIIKTISRELDLRTKSNSNDLKKYNRKEKHKEKYIY